MKHLWDLTTVEAGDALSKAEVAVIAVGSVEQHGPHLPLDTDAAIAEALAVRLADLVGDRAVLCPPLRYGLSEHHLGFAGTMTLRPETFAALLSDVFESLSHNGVDRVMIVNGHGGNIDAIRLAARQAGRDRGMIVASAMWAIVAHDVVRQHAVSDVYGHACETETSVMLALMPDRVRTDRIPAEIEFTSVDELTDPPRSRIDEPVRLDQWSKTGAIGHPSAASAVAGEAIVAAFLDRTVGYVERMIERPPPGVPT